MKDGYSQGMCDLLAPLLVVFQDEATTYACFLRVMAYAQVLFPPSNGMNTKLANLQALMQVSYCIHAYFRGTKFFFVQNPIKCTQQIFSVEFSGRP